MAQLKGGKVAAVIHIGSNLVEMKICQVQKKQVVPLDHLEHPLRFGHEVFHEGVIHAESLAELIETLQGFQSILKDYGVEECRVVATTAFREAKNHNFAADQIRIQTHLQVEILEDNQEKTWIYSGMCRAVQEYQESGKALRRWERALVSHIGTGSIGLGVLEDHSLIFSQNVSTGSLKIHDILGGLEDETEEFDVVVEEYLDAIFRKISMPFPPEKLECVVLTGNEIPLIASLCGIEEKNRAYVIPTSAVEKLYQEMRLLTLEKIGFQYSLSENQAESLYSSLAIYTRLFQLAQTEQVLALPTELWDPMFRQMLLPKAAGEYDDFVEKNAVLCAKTFARRYQCCPNHAEQVTLFACKIFDRMKRIHGLHQRHRVILELACILHDCGHFVDSRRHLESTYDIIQNLDVCGLTSEEMQMAAYVARFDELEPPNYDDLDFIHIREEQKLVCSKLAAIFRLAGALDKSQKQKLPDIQVKVEEERLVISAKCTQNFHLELWALERCAPFFKDVFGISPHLALQAAFL